MLRPWNLEIQIDAASAQPVYLQIADTVIEAIRSGRLKSGDALPGSRSLAALLQVNRNTVVEALNVLMNEEWIVSRERKGYFVAGDIPSPVATGRYNKQPDLLQPDVQRTAHIVFDDGHPDSKIAPVDELARAYRQLFSRKARWQMMGYGDELGDVAFRKAIAQMLNHQRGMQISEQHICITRGSQMAMYLAAHCLLQPGDHVLVEQPGYRPAWRAFEQAGAVLLPVRVDGEGVMIEDITHWLVSGKKIKAIYVTPHHQYPTTVTLSLQRRLELIRLSNEHGFTIIEDDYDNEFHFGYRPVLPLSSYSEVQHYVYVGTMSKVVAPALRIGFMVSGCDYIRKAASLRKIIDVQGDAIMEQAVLQLIQEGTVKRHLKKATAYYKAKRDRMAALIGECLGEKVFFEKPDGGLAFWIVPRQPVDLNGIIGQLEKKGIRFTSPDHYSDDRSAYGLRLGYASMPEALFREGLEALASLL